MKKLILILSVFPFICFAQEIQTKEKSKLSIGVSFAPEYANRTIKAIDAVGESILPYNEDEKGKFGFTTGVNLDYQIVDRLSFETGMLFSNKGYKKNAELREFEDSELTNVKIRFNFYYLEVPLRAKFYFAELQGFRYYASVGLAPEFYISSNMRFSHNGMSSTEIYPDGSIKFNKLNLSGLLGLGFKYDFNSDLFLDVEAGYKHSFWKMDDLSTLKRHLYSLGLDFTLYYRL